MTQNKLTAAISLAFVFLAGCSNSINQAGDSSALTDLTESKESALVGGQLIDPRTDLRGRSTALIQTKIKEGTASCTATVVGKRILLTAAHCVDGGQEMSVQLTAAPNAKVIPTAAISHPSYKKDGKTDLALILLKSDVPAGVVIAEMATTDTKLKLKQLVVSYGYGIHAVVDEEYLFGLIKNNERRNDKRLRKAAFTLVAAQDTGAIGEQAFDADLLITVANGSSLCQGDSGGPTFLPLKNQATVIGVNSFINTENCESSLNGIADIRPHADWIKASIEVLKAKK